jgi:hypothetical protein
MDSFAEEITIVESSTVDGVLPIDVDQSHGEILKK